MAMDLQRIEDCVSAIRTRTELTPEFGVVLGSGLGAFAEEVQNAVTIPFSELPGFPVSTVPGHAGRFVLGTVGKTPVAVLQGRVHYYEGYPMEDVLLPVRVLAGLGAKKLLLTNAAGGIGQGLAAGDLMLLTDHIASFMPSPLRGENEESLGPRFPDLSEVYSHALRERMERAAQKLQIPLKQGVYLQTPGPSYETPAEIRLYRALGADAVGMSTAVEAVAARHIGLEVCGVSCITNLAAGLSEAPLSHEEVQAAAKEAGGRFRRLLWEFLSGC